MREVRALVVGDLMLDHYIWGSCERISPEAPVQVVKIKNETKRLGGAGNVVLNLLSLGAKVGVMSVLGDDETGDEIEWILREQGARAEFIKREKGRTSSIKSRVMATHQQVVRIDKESVEAVTCEDELAANFARALEGYDVALLSDYGKGVLTPTLCQKLIKACSDAGKPVLIDPKGADYSKYKGATLLTPNKKEAGEAVGFKIENDEQLFTALNLLKAQLVSPVLYKQSIKSIENEVDIFVEFGGSVLKGINKKITEKLTFSVTDLSSLEELLKELK